MATRLLGAIGIGFSLFALNRLSEEFGGVNDQIRNATANMGDQREIQSRILQAANDTRQSYAQMANTVSRLAQGGAFADLESAANFATLMAQDFAAAGISQEKSAYLTRYITMDLQKGSMSARTLSTMLRDAPHMATRLAGSLGVSTYQLQEMARRGEISADVLRDNFINSADDIAARFGQTNMTISDALRNIRNQWGAFVTEMDSTIGITRVIASGMVGAFNHMLQMLRRAQDAFMRLANRMGGVNNLMRLLAISAAGIFVALNAQRILGFFRTLTGLLKPAKLKILAIAAVFILLALLVEDFIAFMRGDDSMIGQLLENMGFDVAAIRERILAIWSAIREFLARVWRLIRQVISAIGNWLRDFWDRWGEQILAAFRAIFATLWSIIRQVANAIWEVVQHVFGAIKAFWERWGEDIPAGIRVVFNVLREIFAVAWVFISEFIASIGDKIGLVVSCITGLVDAIKRILGGIIDFIAGVFTGDWSRAWEGIKNIFGGIVDGLINAFKFPINAIISMLNVFIRGLNRLQIPNWVPGVGGRGINIPEIPMLAKGSDYSPDTFIAGEAGPELITNAKGSKVFTAAETVNIFGKLQGIDSIYSRLKAIVSLASAPTSAQSIAQYASAAHYKNIVINQDVQNTFHGERAGQEKSAVAMDAATDDVLGELARALAYC